MKKMEDLPPITVSVIIPTHNRLNYLLEALESALKQKFEDYYSLSITISDNSTNPDTEKYFAANKYPNVTYIKRSPPVSGPEHFNIILKEVNTDFFMLFHDDNIMKEDMLATLLKCFTPSIVAVSSNAYLLDNNKKTKKKLIKDSYNTPSITATKRELLDRYIMGKGIPVFPSYLYRHIVSQTPFNLKYNKHGDIHFIAEILKHGSTFFVKEPLFYNRYHSEQDSFYSDFIGLSRLLDYSIKECGYSKKDKLVIDSRLKNIYIEYRTQLLKKNPPSIKRISQFMTLCMATYNIVTAGKLAGKYIQYKLA